MTQEQKAKAYDEVIERAKGIHRFSSNLAEIKRMEEIFPELKESEDERIRKAIGYAIGQSTHSDGTLINGVSSEEALAWLKKQSERKSVLNELEMTLSVSEEGYLRENIEKLIKEFKGN